MYLKFTSPQLLASCRTLIRTCKNSSLEGLAIRPISVKRTSFQELDCHSESQHNRWYHVQNLYQNYPCDGISLQQKRFYRSGRGGRHTGGTDNSSVPQKSAPELMNFPWIIWPNLWHSIRNWIFTNFIIRPYLDKDFTIASFKTGAIQALVHVSHELSKGNFAGLDGFITQPSLEEAQTNFALLSLKQRLDLAVVSGDIFFCFPYQIGIMFTNEGSSKERVFVEITMCYHVFRGFQDHIESLSKTDNAGNMKGVYDNYDRISIANYRFIREYTKGVDSDWIVNVANHFKPGGNIQ